jgi:hypothetical protein
MRTYLYMSVGMSLGLLAIIPLAMFTAWTSTAFGAGFLLTAGISLGARIGYLIGKPRKKSEPRNSRPVRPLRDAVLQQRSVPSQSTTYTKAEPEKRAPNTAGGKSLTKSLIQGDITVARTITHNGRSLTFRNPREN